MDSIRIRSAAKVIEVNDAGETITLNFGDQDFPNRFFAMLDRVQARATQAEQEEKAIRSSKDQDEAARALAAFSADLHRFIMAEVDGVFGANTCRKVFGDIVPGVELFDEFFTALMPYFEQYGKERAQRLQKYSAQRSGDV